MNKKNITLMVVAVLTLITFVGLATYAYFVGSINTGNTSNVTTTPTGPTSYWFAVGTYTFPNYGGTLQTSGTATSHNVYIGQDATKYYVCLYIDGDEVCLSQPYTQYGLEDNILNKGRLDNRDFTTEEQNSAKAAIREVFSDAGITGYSCDSNSLGAACFVGDFYCGVYSGGDVRCGGNDADLDCGVTAGGSAYCFTPRGRIY